MRNEQTNQTAQALGMQSGGGEARPAGATIRREGGGAGSGQNR
jgi:hypothetical protein